MSKVLNAIRSYSEKLLTHHTRRARLHTMRIVEINNVFDVLWKKKVELIECDAYDDVLGAMTGLLGVAEEESELIEAEANVITEATKEMLEAL